MTHRIEKNCFHAQMIVETDVIGGRVCDTKYARELLTVDLAAQPKDGDLVVYQYTSSTPHMARWKRTGCDEDGRAVPEGHPGELITLSPYCNCTEDDFREGYLKIIGVVVGPEREFPRPWPTAFQREVDLAVARAAAPEDAL